MKLSANKMKWNERGKYIYFIAVIDKNTIKKINKKKIKAMKRSSTSMKKTRKTSVILENQMKAEAQRKPFTSEKHSRSHSSFKISIARTRQLERQNPPPPTLLKKQSSIISPSSKPSSPLKQRLSGRSSGKKPGTSLQTNRSSKPIPEQIQSYIDSRKDVEIVQHFQSYKKQFYTKSKILHEYIYKSDEPQKIKNTYLNETDSHFRNGLEACMLKLFREGVIVPDSYDNLREEAVENIQRWVIGWIHRKIDYGRLVEEEENQGMVLQGVMRELENFKREIETEDTSF